MAYYERRLPHWDAVGQPVFVTFRLEGSLPTTRVFPPERLQSGRAFLAMDRLLDRSDCGPRYLRQPEIAGAIVQAIHDGQTRFQRYQIHAFVVMPNHVHLLVTPQVNARQWLGPLKGFTASQANRLLGRSGPCWQDESYDHLVRNDREFAKIINYVEQNPVRAGLVESPEEYPWSSAAPGRSPAAGSKA